MAQIDGQRSFLVDGHNVGGKLIRLPAGIKSRAIFGGPNDCYRYTLERIWDETLPSILFIMMNPSTATEYWDDATLQKVRNFAIRWGFGRLLVGNTMAYRCTDQARLIEVDDPEGPENVTHIMKMAKEAQKVVLAYGTPKIKALLPYGPALASKLVEVGIRPYTLKLSAVGRPWHPLYLSGDTELSPWTGSSVKPSFSATAP